MYGNVQACQLTLWKWLAHQEAQLHISMSVCWGRLSSLSSLDDSYPHGFSDQGLKEQSSWTCLEKHMPENVYRWNLHNWRLKLWSLVLVWWTWLCLCFFRCAGILLPLRLPSLDGSPGSFVRYLVSNLWLVFFRFDKPHAQSFANLMQTESHITQTNWKLLNVSPSGYVYRTDLVLDRAGKFLIPWKNNFFPSNMSEKSFKRAINIGLFFFLFF